jgi:hypothetical protein
VTDEVVDEDEEKYHWVVIFNRHGKVYPYMYRTISYMTQTVKKFHAEHNRWPYLMWVIVGEEMQKVNIE